MIYLQIRSDSGIRNKLGGRAEEVLFILVQSAIPSAKLNTCKSLERSHGSIFPWVGDIYLYPCDPEPACAAWTLRGRRTWGHPFGDSLGAAGWAAALERTRCWAVGHTGGRLSSLAGLAWGWGWLCPGSCGASPPRTQRGEGEMQSGLFLVSGPLLMAAVQSPRR